MKLIDPSQRINVLWDNDDGTRYAEEMTIRRLLAVMSEDEIETIDLVRCGECANCSSFDDQTINPLCSIWGRFTSDDTFCSYGERREDGEIH